MTNLIVKINTGSVDLPVGGIGTTYTDFSVGNDFLIFSAGSDTVINGGAIPSSFQLSQAGIVLTGSDILVPHYFLADISANQLKEATLMGNGNKRYVLAFVFDGITTSEPVLEVWDNVGMNTIDSAALGNGTPSLSWIHGITTTATAPGVSWVGSRLAGSSDTHFLWLNNNNGALGAPATLYCNLHMVVPAIQTGGGAESPVIVIKYTST